MEEKDLLLEQLKIASEHHRHIDNMAWQGLSHLLTWNGILFSALGVIVTGDPCWTRNASGHLKVQLPCAIVAFFVALLGLAISIGWGHVQKRSQMYHRVRIAQAVHAEKRLTELIDAENLSVRVYPDRPPLEIYTKEIDEVRSRLRWFGKPEGHTIVFHIALIIATAWLVVLLGALWLVVLSVQR